MNSRAITMFVLILAILFYCLDYYFRIVPGLVIPQLMTQYHIKTLGIGGFASAFYLGYLIMQIPCGYILDNLPLRYVLLLTIFPCTIIFILFLYTNSYFLGCILRFAIGLLSAFSFVSVLYIARAYFSEKYFSLISGITIGLGTMAAALAQIISAALMSHFNWHFSLVFLACWGIIIAVALCFPQVNLSQPKKHPRPSMKESLKQIRLLCQNRFILINALIGSLFYLPTSIFAAVWGVSFLQNTYHFTATNAAGGILAIFAGWAAGSPVLGWLGDQIKNQRYLICFAAISATLISICLIYYPAFTHDWVYVALFLFGLCSSAQVLVWKIFTKHCPKQITGSGIALTNMLIILSATFFHLTIGWLLTPTQQNHFANFNEGLSIIPLAFFAVVLLSFLLKDRR